MTTNNIRSTATLLPEIDDTYDLGTVALRWTNLWATNGTIQTSDFRQKKEIEDVGYGLSEILKLRPVSYKWKEGSDESTHLGLIAQEVQKVVGEVVVVGDDENSSLGLRYQELIPVLINAIKELQSENESRERKVADMQNRLETLENLMKISLANNDDN